MQPGVPASRAVREFAQITTSKALAATVPLASVRLGDSKGSALGLNIAHGPLLAENIPCGPTSSCCTTSRAPPTATSPDRPRSPASSEPARRPP